MRLSPLIGGPDLDDVRGSEGDDVAGRPTSTGFDHGELVRENVVVHMSGTLACTVGFERGVVRVDGAAPQPMTIRVTHVYRDARGEWRLVHRHAHFPPRDQRADDAAGATRASRRRTRA